jgi:hypothetical protein
MKRAALLWAAVFLLAAIGSGQQLAVLEYVRIAGS